MWADIQFAVLAGRGINPLLGRWLAGVRAWRAFPGASARRRIPGARNRICRWFIEECDLPWLAMLDDDMVVLGRTDPLWRSPAMVASARAVARTGRRAHPHTGLSAACLKVHRRALEAIAPPWFAWPPGGGCECAYFFARAVAAGLRPEVAGEVGHRFPVVVLPGNDGPRFHFEHEVHSVPTRSE